MTAPATHTQAHVIQIKHPPAVLPDELARMYDFRRVCRICANYTDQVLPMYTEGQKFDIVGKIRKYLPIKLTAGERMPQGICASCASAVLSWHELVRSARLADFMLRRRLDATAPAAPYPKPSETAGTEVTKDGVKYVDAGTDPPELPPERHCSFCSLMIPSKKFNSHMFSTHRSVTYRCEECHSYLNKDELLFHMDNHACDLVPEHIKIEYYKNEKAFLDEDAKIETLAQIEVNKINEYFLKKAEAWKRQREEREKLQMEKKMNEQSSDKNNESTEKVSITDTDTPNNNSTKSKTDELQNDTLQPDKVNVATVSVKKKAPKCEIDEIRSEAPPEQDCDVDRSPPKRKRSDPKNVDAKVSPAKRQRKNKSVAKNQPKSKEVDDGNDGDDDDEVNTPKAGPSAKAIKAKEEGSDKSPKTSRTCPICGKEYRASSSYFYHMKYFHKRSREHECTVCNKKFGTKTGLAQHTSIHTGAYDFECKECGKRFKSKPSLYIHEQSHNGPKRWACSQCGRSFRWRTHLARHVTRHAAERKHACSTCGRGFSVRCDMLRHARTHTADEYHCATCGLKFAQKRYLQVHMAKKHSEAPPPAVTRS